jgi:hypothetical protein
MSDTPRTDAVFAALFGPIEDFTPNQRKALDFARTLERELAEAAKEMERYRHAYDIACDDRTALRAEVARYRRNEDMTLDEHNEEIGRWQTEIRELLIQLSGAPDSSIDGSGCDSGDPLDLTKAEIRQAFSFLIEHALAVGLGVSNDL